MPDATTNNAETLLARLVVEQGLATAQDIEEARKAQQLSSAQDASSHRSLASVLVDQGVVTQKQIERLRPQVDEPKGGQQIPGFVLLERLGAGAMATVYKARQVSLDRMVAIKILPRKLTNNAEFVQRFYAEGRSAAKLNHPNIVGALDVGKAGEYYYFVMEYVEGRTVYDDIVDRGRYSEGDALAIMIQIAKALEHAHKAGFIHRDVKPKNIMITPQRVAKLADMGLARAVSDREAAEAEQGKAFGTPYYISPEQIRGDLDVDFRADIYGFGAMFYHMVTGQIPFEGANPTAVMHKHLKAKLVPPDHINPELSAGISEIVEVCMAKDRDERYSTMTDLLQDLEAVARGEPPLQARKKFDLASLSSLEEPIAPPAEDRDKTVDIKVRAARLALQPAFWAAIVGWIVASFLLLALLKLR